MTPAMVARGTAVIGDAVRRADLPWTPDALRVRAPAALLGPAFLAHLLGVSRPLLVAAVVAPGVVAVVWFASRVARRPHRVMVQMPDALRGIAAGVRAGMSLRRALARAGQSTPTPAGPELRRVADALEAGDRTGDALDALAARVPHAEMDMLACVVAVVTRSGGDLARVLGDAADGMEQRLGEAAHLSSLSAQARATAWLVATLPIAGAAIVELMAPGVLARTLDAGPARAAIIAGVAMLLVAVLAVRRLARVDP